MTDSEKIATLEVEVSFLRERLADLEKSMRGLSNRIEQVDKTVKNIPKAMKARIPIRR